MKASLKTKLFISYLVVILICGLVATIVGTQLIGTATTFVVRIPFKAESVSRNVCEMGAQAEI